MSRPITFDPRASEARARFRVRDFAPVVARVARYGVALYVAQAAAGFAIGFTVPFLRVAGVF